MASQFDITVLPLHRSEGIEQNLLPGVAVFNPPRRTARGRNNDRLILYLQLEGALRLTREQHVELLEGAAKVFYDSAGSVTSALRALIETLNEVILAHNMRGGQPATALVNAVAVRDDNLYIGQSGPSHCFLLAAGKLEYFYDAQAAGRGLGVGRTPAVRFFQAGLSQGALFLVVPRIPKEWNEKTIQSAVGQSMSVAARRFLGDAGSDLRAIVMEARAGGQNIQMLKANSGLAASAGPEAAAKQTPPVEPAISQVTRPEHPPQAAVETPATATPRRPAARSEPLEPDLEPADESQMKQSSRRAKGPGWAERLTPITGQVGTQVRDLASRASRALGNLFTNMLPSEDMLNIPGWVMGFIAVIVPLVVVLIAVIVYTNIGRDRLYESYLEQAQAAAVEAQALGTGLDSRAAWEQALYLLDYTEQYEITPETSSLRLQAQKVLDDLDGIVRLNFKPGVSGILSPAIEIRKMVATATDLYMLDINSGSVLRAWLTGTGYEMDPTFRCGPGSYGAFIVGPLVDITTLSKFNPEDATIIAMDANGNLLYCIPGEAPLAVQLVPPDVLWGNPIGITLDEGDLYVLDPKTNAVWLYQGVDESFPDPPRFFFDAAVPPLETAIDIAVNASDLYILHSDGHTTHCVFSSNAAAQTNCEDPVVFNDPRPGYDSGALIEGARFYQVQRTLPPEPSVFYLDPITRSVYHFSLQLRLTAQYRAMDEFPEGLATAFTVSPNRIVFIALDNQLYASPLP